MYEEKDGRDLSAWGLEEYFSTSQRNDGYANGQVKRPTDQRNDPVQRLRQVTYDPDKIIFSALYHFVIDLCPLTQAGNDRGRQWTGVYDEADRQCPPVSRRATGAQDRSELFVLCHYIWLRTPPRLIQEESWGITSMWCRVAFDRIQQLPEPGSKGETDSEQYQVSEQQTERPFHNVYDQTFEEGIMWYTLGSFRAKVISLFWLWMAKFRPIAKDVVIHYYQDHTEWSGIEVRSLRQCPSRTCLHRDGPKDQGGLRYCINSALRFIPKEEQEG